VCWFGHLSGARCRLAYGSADATASCFSKVQIHFSFLVSAHPGSPGKGHLTGACMFVSVHAVLVVRLACCRSVQM